jgi:hypothetical protein
MALSEPDYVERIIALLAEDDADWRIPIPVACRDRTAADEPVRRCNEGLYQRSCKDGR